MRIRVARRLAIMSLCFLAHLGTQSCSSSSEGEGDVEANEEGNAAEGENGANPDGDANANAAPENNENLAQNTGDTGDPAASGEATADVPPTDTTNNDLKEVMQDVNATQQATADAGAAPEATAEAAPEAAPAAPPVAVGSGPAGGALPEFGSKMPYIVQPGDTLAKIAGKLYGDTGKWKLLASLSNLARPNRIYPGDVVYYQLTKESQKFAQAYETVPRQEVKAEAGDTLAKISQRVLGSKVHWRSIWRQNDNIDNPDEIAAGSSIYYIQPSQLASLFNDISSRTIAASKNITNKVLGAEIVVNKKSNNNNRSTKNVHNWAGAKASANSQSQNNDIALDLVVSGISAILI